MGDHGANRNGEADPVDACLGAPSVQHVAESRIRKARNEHPQAHLGFFDTAVAPSEEDNDVVAQHARTPADTITNEGGKEDEACCGGAKVVGRICQDLGNGVERHDAGCAAEGKDKTGL